MKRHMIAGMLALLTVAPLVAQTPKGWKMRVDRSTSASDPDAPGAIKFVQAGSGFHATNPQAAVFFNPANTATGTYTRGQTTFKVTAYQRVAVQGSRVWQGIVICDQRTNCSEADANKFLNSIKIR